MNGLLLVVERLQEPVLVCSQRDDAALKMFCSIAFPAISTGVYGYPLEDATEIAVDTVAD